MRVAAADVNGDSVPDILCAPGPGLAPVVKIFDGFTFELIREIPVLTPTFRGGVNFALGDVLGTTAPELIVAPGAGHLPRVEVYDPTTIAAPLVTFLAYSSSFRRGVRVTTINSDATGKREVAVAPQSGGGSLVKIFDTAVAVPVVIKTVQAYAASYGGGVFIASGDVNNDGRDELIVGAGSGAPTVKIFNLTNNTQLTPFNAHGPGFTGGGQLAGVRLAGGGGATVVVVARKKGVPFIKVVSANTGLVRGEFAPLGLTSKLPVFVSAVNR